MEASTAQRVDERGGGSDYPRNWRFDEDGGDVEGRYVRISAAPTSYGEKPIVVLEIDGEERSVWLLETALRNRIADEVAKRPSGDLTPGERVVIHRGDKKTSAAGREYRAFTARFPDAPKRSAAEILGASSESAAENESASGASRDDDIPF